MPPPDMSRISELFGVEASAHVDWRDLVERQHCPYLDRKCLKVRKSQAEISIGTCSIRYGRAAAVVIICPFRLLERKQVFTDCLHLLTLHEPGNELHIVTEIAVPGGSVDYFLVSANGRRVIDFVGIELQTLDTTGTLWPERQRFLLSMGLPVSEYDAGSSKGFGMNWKMTAKTILVQLHHKVETFQGINKHLALVIQDCLLDYMRREFNFGHLQAARLGDPMHIHAYGLGRDGGGFRLGLRDRLSTDTKGISACLGLQVSPNMELEEVVKLLEAKISDKTLLTL
jgi:hypothetical protein